MPSITLAFQRGALLAVSTWQGSQPTAVFKANREHQCVSECVCTRGNTQFLLVRLSTAVDKWSQAAHKLTHIHKPTAGLTLILYSCSAKCLKCRILCKNGSEVTNSHALCVKLAGVLTDAMNLQKKKQLILALDFSKSLCQTQAWPLEFNNSFFGGWVGTQCRRFAVGDTRSRCFLWFKLQGSYRGHRGATARDGKDWSICFRVTRGEQRG